MSATDRLLKESGISQSPGGGSGGRLSGTATSSLLQQLPQELERNRARSQKRKKEDEEERRRRFNSLQGIVQGAVQSGNLSGEQTSKLYKALADEDIDTVKNIGLGAVQEDYRDKSFGEKAGNFVKGSFDELAGVVDRSFVRPIEGLVTANTNIKSTEQALVEQLQDEYIKRVNNIDKKLKSGDITEQQANILKQGAEVRLNTDTAQATQRQADISTEDYTLPERARKATGTAIEGASTFAGGMTVKSAAGSILKNATGVGARSIGTGSPLLRTTVAGGSQGGGIMFGSSLQSDDFTISETVKNTATGALFGSVAGAGLSGASQYASKWYTKKLRKGAITDESRLLPEKAGRGAQVIEDKSRLLEAGRQDPNLAVISHGADPEDLRKLRDVDQRIREAQVKKNITADEARALIKEKRQIQARIQNPKNAVGKRMAEIDRELAEIDPKENPDRAIELGDERSILEQEAAQNAVRSKNINNTNPNKIRPKAAERAEAFAIKEGVTRGFEDDPGLLDKMNLEQQANAAVAFMDMDYDGAKKVALGLENPPGNLRASVVYRGVINRAVKEGDEELVRKLSIDSAVAKEGTRKGQEIAGFNTFDPESPVDDLRQIAQARKKNNLPAEVSAEETKQVMALSKEMDRLKKEIDDNSDDVLDQEMAYGRARVAKDNYVNGLIESAKQKSIRDQLKTVEGTVELAKEGAYKGSGLSKTLKSTLDLSAPFRQGYKLIWNKPGIWLKSNVQMFKAVKGTIEGKDMIDEINAYVVSRPNARNGLYKKAGLDVYKVREEAFPVRVKDLPKGLKNAAKPLKASDAAYTSFLQKARVDYFDFLIQRAHKKGLDISDPKLLKSYGKVANSMTGRGELPRDYNVLNRVLFSPKLNKSNIDYLTAHWADPNMDVGTKRLTTTNLFRTAAGTAATIAVSAELFGTDVEWDPRSSDFGKIKVGSTRLDLTGGMGGFVTLFARTAMQSSKSSTSGEVTEYEGGYLSRNTWEDLINFSENKLSPVAGTISDIMERQRFGGEPVTVANTVESLLMPLTIANYKELNENKDSANILLAMTAEILGIGTNTYGLDQKWDNKDTKIISAFKKKVSDEQFQEANEKTNDRFKKWYEGARETDGFWDIPQDTRLGVVRSRRQKIAAEVMKEYGFEYEPEERSNKTQNVIDELDRQLNNL